MTKRYQVYRSVDLESFLLIGETSDRHFIDTSAGVNTTYYYKVRQMDGPLPGNFSNIFSINVLDTSDSTAPTIPIFNYAESSSATITLYWFASEDEGGVSFYNIYRSDGSPVSFSLIDTTSLLSYTDSDLNSGTDYFYKLSATDFSGNTSDQSDTILVTTTTVVDDIPPTTPVFISANSSSSEITLFWSASTDNVGVDYYNIYRSNTTNSFSVVGTSSITSYNDTNLPIGPYYHYKLSAVDTSNNESDLSSDIEIFIGSSSYYELYEIESSDGESFFYYGLAYEFFDNVVSVPEEFELIYGSMITASLSVSGPPNALD